MLDKKQDFTTNKFESLDVWKNAHKFVLQIYKLTKRFPSEERFRLIDQLCRSASSVPANIVEGNSRAHKAEFIQFLYLSKGSLEETKYHLLLARDLGYISADEYKLLMEQANLTGRLLSGLIKYIKGQKSNIYGKS